MEQSPNQNADPPKPIGLAAQESATRERNSMLFLGLARDCEASIGHFFTYLDQLDQSGIKTAAIIGENASRDRTRKILVDANDPRVEVFDTSMMAAGANRLARMAIGRQALLERAQSRKLGETFICVVDLDNVMLAPPTPESVLSAIKRLMEDDSLFAVGATSRPVYYDLLALRAEGHDYSALHEELQDAKKRPLTYFQFHRRRIYRNQRRMTLSQPIPCASTFNGFCLYKAQDYYLGTFRSPEETQICEHVTLNLAIGRASGKHMLIAPELCLQAPADHRPVGFFRFWFDRIRERLP